MKKISLLFVALLTFILQINAQIPIPTRGTVFNESEWISDSITGRKVLRLTKNRDFNQTPTYHIFTGFSADSRYLVFASWNKGGQSALLKGDMVTGDITVISVVPASEKEHFNGNNVCMIPATQKAAASRGGTKVCVYDLNTLEEKILYTAEEGFTFGHPTGSTDGKTIYVTKMPRYKEGTDDPYKVALSIYYSIDIATGKKTEFFRDSSRSNHTVVCPSNPDLLLIDRDLPPKYGSGGDNGKTTRVWLLNIKTKKLTEIRPENKNRFQIHSNWSHDGKFVYYHGVSQQHNFPGGFTGKPHFIGVADQSGKIIWEHIFPNFFYGHICSSTIKNTIITDGLMFGKLITEVDWNQLDSQGVPVLNVLGAHNSGNHSFGQHTHPHCLMSPDGKYLSYNKGTQNKSDVYVMTIR
jgi:Tol biopolymer transport system component